MMNKKEAEYLKRMAVHLFPAFMYAVKEGNETSIRALVAAGADVNLGERSNSNFPLRAACAHNRPAIVRLLLELGADVSATSFEGVTALHWVCHTGNLPVARILLDHGADVNAENQQASTPLHYLCTNTGAPERTNVKEDRIGLATLLIGKGAKVNARDMGGEAPLHFASSNFTAKDAGDLVRLLLEKGADVNAKDNTGRFPLHWAMGNYLPLTCKILLDAGADPNAPDGGGITPLDQVIALPDSHPAREKLLDLFRDHAPEAVMEAYCTQGCSR
ncbi:MAG: hypothetical protein GXX82_15335 [Syntrophorhabdus sp.]|nr:hypothetical protein [Syntrophorhabdus sp.]